MICTRQQPHQMSSSLIHIAIRQPTATPQRWPLQRHAATYLTAFRATHVAPRLGPMLTDQSAHPPCRGLLLTKHDKADEDAADGVLWSAAAFYKIHSASLGLSAGRQHPQTFA